MLSGNNANVKVTPSWDIICCDSFLGVNTSNQGYADISLGLDYYWRENVYKFQENKYQTTHKEIGL